MVVITPNAKGMIHRLFGDKWLGLDPPRHLHLFTRSSLQSWAEREKFKIIKCISTARAARGSYFGSRVISRFGKMDILRHAPPNIAVRIVGEVLEMINSILVLFNGDIGEDLVLICQKSKYGSVEDQDAINP